MKAIPSDAVPKTRSISRDNRTEVDPSLLDQGKNMKMESCRLIFSPSLLMFVHQIPRAMIRQ
jgi:hypothetical protein